MLIIGVDYHPSFQQNAFLNQETGECGERRLNHSDGEAERFYNPGGPTNKYLGPPAISWFFRFGRFPRTIRMAQ